jgi:hypothetical protein
MCMKERVLCVCVCVRACVCACVCADRNEKTDVQTTFINPQEMRLPRTSRQHRNMPHTAQGIWRQQTTNPFMDMYSDRSFTVFVTLA